jgi:SPP1 family predicted phage head-tail adaptor
MTTIKPRRGAIQAGKLRTVIQIQARDDGQDAAGQPLDSFSTIWTVWARVVSVAGNEDFKGVQFSPEVSHQVTIRWMPGVTPLHRIVTDSDQILDIITVNYGERRIDPILMTCKERISQGGDLDVG